MIRTTQLLVLTALASGCSSGLECTEMSCEDSFVVSLEPSGDAGVGLGSGEYIVSVTAEGGSSSWSCTVGRAGTCEVSLAFQGTLSSITVGVVRDGVDLGSHEVTPDSPNGPRCGPTCTTGVAVVEL